MSADKEKDLTDPETSSISSTNAEKDVSEPEPALNSIDDKQDDQEDTKSKTTSTNEDDDDDDDTDSNASSEYEVEKILGKRRRRRGGFEYYIKWVGYDNSANEWIPESGLNCPERLAEFEREETRKRKRKQTNRRSNNNSRTSSKRRKVLVDDDIDETTPTSPIIPTQQTKTEQEPESYGVERGYKVQAVLGINRQKDNQLHYLVHYEGSTTIEDNMELLPATIAHIHCEDEIIQFFESRITWNNHPKDRS